MTIKLFISHASADVELAQAIVDAIRASAEIADECIRCTSLYPYRLCGGDSIVHTLREDITSAKVVIGILTPKSMESQWTLCELGAVWGRVKNLVPVIAGLRLEDVKGPLGVQHIWRMSDINEVGLVIEEVLQYFDDEIKRRRVPARMIAEAQQKIVALAKKYRHEAKAIPVGELYSLNLPSNELRVNDKVFQNFKISKDCMNVNSVHFFWTDSFTNSSIKAFVMTKQDENFLRIWFENGVRYSEQGDSLDGWASNIKIRPQNEKALCNPNLKYKYLHFHARIPSDGAREDDLDKVGISVRLLDRRLTYWQCGVAASGQPYQHRITKNNEWQRCSIALQQSKYSVFSDDGNHNQRYLNLGEDGKPHPDLSVIAGVTFVLGRYTGNLEEPRGGKGVIDIREIYLSAS